MVLSLVAATILSLLASALQEPQQLAKELDRSKEMMIAAKILDPRGFFIIEDAEGKITPAKFEPGGGLAPAKEEIQATDRELLEVYTKRFRPLLTNDNGETKTFQELNLNEAEYLSFYRKSGYYNEPWKLLYAILPNHSAPQETQAVGYVIPVNGYGLWDAIYGYIALKPDGDTVIGISWYDQKETPGLGANITEADWQDLFPGKLIFQESVQGKTDFERAPLGITVVKGKVAEVFGNSPKAKSAVDGMAGATITGNGVTDAYRDVLSAYRPFLIKIHDKAKS